jgi:hypothetical protein
LEEKLCTFCKHCYKDMEQWLEDGSGFCEKHCYGVDTLNPQHACDNFENID